MADKQCLRIMHIWWLRASENNKERFKVAAISIIMIEVAFADGRRVQKVIIFMSEKNFEYKKKFQAIFKTFESRTWSSSVPV